MGVVTLGTKELRALFTPIFGLFRLAVTLLTRDVGVSPLDFEVVDQVLPRLVCTEQPDVAVGNAMTYIARGALDKATHHGGFQAWYAYGM